MKLLLFPFRLFLIARQNFFERVIFPDRVSVSHNHFTDAILKKVKRKHNEKEKKKKLTPQKRIGSKNSLSDIVWLQNVYWI